MTSPDDSAEAERRTSALQDNIKQKGSNAYYFAHAHKANGPVWDGKEQPKLLAKTSSSIDGNRASTPSSFDIKSNITSYAFCDEGSMVKLYITMEGVGEKCADEDITLEHTDRSFCLLVNNYKEGNAEPMCLSMLRLTADITAAKFRKKKDRIILTLTKTDPEKEWHTINCKGEPDHELV